MGIKRKGEKNTALEVHACWQIMALLAVGEQNKQSLFHSIYGLVYERVSDRTWLHDKRPARLALAENHSFLLLSCVDRRRKHNETNQ